MTNADERPDLPHGRIAFLILLGLAGLTLAHLPPAGRWWMNAGTRTIEGVTFHGRPPAGSTLVESWFYVLAWWSYIALASGVVHLVTRRSLLLGRPRAFGLLALHSAAFWLAFELVNLRLSNWYYVGVPPDRVSRSLGMLLAFATVLPGILVTSDLVGATGLFARARSRPIAFSFEDMRD